jgi:histidinol-phosphate aminotransferase
MNSVNRFIRPEILASKAYPVSDATGFIKLDAMENPFEFPEQLRAGLLDCIGQVQLNRYPVPSYLGLKAALRKTYSIDEHSAIMVGNGSDELIDIITKAVAARGAAIVAPVPSFVMYGAAAMQAQIKFIGVPLRQSDFSLDLPALLEAIDVHQPAVVWLALPNNPTGNSYATADVQAVLAAAPGIVVMDEAYEPFSPLSWMPRLAEFDNLIVMRTVSKWGLAGLRLGYMAGSATWLEQLEKIRPPYNVNVMTDSVAQYCLAHETVFAQQCTIMCEQRDRLYAAVSALPGVTAFVSDANFVLARFANSQATYQGLKSDGLLVKDMSFMHASLKNCLRLSVGTPAQTTALVTSLQKHYRG